MTLDFLTEPRIYKTLTEPRTDKRGSESLYNDNFDVNVFKASIMID